MKIFFVDQLFERDYTLIFGQDENGDLFWRSHVNHFRKLKREAGKLTIFWEFAAPCPFAFTSIVIGEKT